MSDSTRRPSAQKVTADTDFTQQIKKLTLPAADDPLSVEHDEPSHRALLISRDSAAKKWGPRWLKQAGIEAVVHTDSATAVIEANNQNPSVIIIDADFYDAAGSAVYAQFAQSTRIEAPIIVLCSSTKDLNAALRANVFDVVRKPYEWQLVGLRAQRAIKFRTKSDNLAFAQKSLARAVQVADQARQQLRSREIFEPVTGLPNKTKFIDLLKRGMNAVDRDKNVLAVLVVGFNRFRLVVEAMGQDRANLAMTEIGKIVSQCLQDAESAQLQTSGLRTAAAASIELAKFGLMFTCSGDDDAVTHLQQQVVEKFSHPIQVSGQAVFLSACVGVALYPQDADDVDQLLQRADNAMRDAQSRGGGFRFYCEETDAAAARKLKLENMLHEALDRNELLVTYQPIVNTQSGRVTSGEALLRWQQPDKSFISPDEFVPIAEDSGLMIRIGHFVLDQVCQQLASWMRSGLPLERMCINVSKAQLVSGDFVQNVARLINQYDINPQSLELELSERGVLSGQFEVLDQLFELKKLGVTLSIDDFGTGDSAIAYLRELPVDTLKIDRSYISGLTNNSKDAALVSAMIALAQKLDLNVIAEGVETPQEIELLKELGCDEFQGFITSPSVSAEEFVAIVKKSQ